MEEPREPATTENDEAGQTELSESELNETIEQLCISKAEEFRLIGYEQVTGQDIWEYISKKYAKTSMPLIHVLVNDILSLKVTQYMNYLTLSMYKGESRF